MRIALVHQIDDFGVGERQRVSVTLGARIADRELIILVASQDGELPVGRKRCVPIVHDGAEIVFDAEWIRIGLLVEIVGIRPLNVLVVNL